MPILVAMLHILTEWVSTENVDILMAEAQKPSWHRGIAIRKVFVRLEILCA